MISTETKNAQVKFLGRNIYTFIDRRKEMPEITKRKEVKRIDKEVEITTISFDAHCVKGSDIGTIIPTADSHGPFGTNDARHNVETADGFIQHTRDMGRGTLLVNECPNGKAILDNLGYDKLRKCRVLVIFDDSDLEMDWDWEVVK